MSSATSTIVVGVVGAVGIIVQALLSNRTNKNQAETFREESAASRKHELNLQIHRRRLDSIEDLWQLLWADEVAGLRQQEVDKVIRCLVWLPRDCQSLSLMVLNSSGQDRVRRRLELRELLISFASGTE